MPGQLLIQMQNIDLKEIVSSPYDLIEITWVFDGGECGKPLECSKVLEAWRGQAFIEELEAAGGKFLRLTLKENQ